MCIYFQVSCTSSFFLPHLVHQRENSWPAWENCVSAVGMTGIGSTWSVRSATSTEWSMSNASWQWQICSGCSLARSCRRYWFVFRGSRTTMADPVKKTHVTAPLRCVWQYKQSTYKKINLLRASPPALLAVLGGFLGWVSVQHFVTSADVRRAL